ncbi:MULTISPECIES: metallophosphoesterase [unclassified Aureimonas]|uniref:metallophosphoesterase n=1 Tax=unclassified Aureimonas TaxID=2615206 RepID=UPI000701FC2E|nr:MULTISPECIES: metallophosphoesterase [unclassified Aureimonas]KQT62572.1 metallophosphoesterase [Aureimonas sp. Leaf427]KQT73201.1 metallophosphoesterase [Aureimonas sp. Leaf460]
MFHLNFSIPCLYVLARFLLPLPWHRRSKIAVGALLLFGSQYHLWGRLSSGSVFSPEFPQGVVLAFNWAFGAILFLAIFQIALDLVGLAKLAFRRPAAIVSTHARYGAAISAMVLAAVAVHQATRLPEPKDVEVSIRGLPAEFDGYQLLQLSDLHLSRLFQEDWARVVVERANALGADLMVVTGDLIDGSVEARRADVEPLRDLRAPDGIWMIPGNHEYYFGYDEWMRRFGELGLRGLTNSHTVLRRGDAGIVLAGLADLRAPANGHEGPDLDAALAGAPADAPVILLEHQPRNAPERAGRADLQLSGHTHGGMIIGLDRLFALANNGFVAGAYRIGEMTMYVSNGTGLWPGFGLRLGKPPELTRITLRPAA